MFNLRKMKSVLMALFLTLSLSQQAWGAGAGKVIDFLVNDTGISLLLSSKGLRNLPASKLKNSAINSLKNLNASGKLPSAYQLKKILRGLNVSGDSVDAAKKAKIQKILNKPAHSITDDEVKDLFNDLIYLSHRYGYSKTTALACGQCVSDALATRGFKYTLEVLENSNTIKVMDNHVPKTPARLKKFIAKEMSNGSFGDFSRATTNQVSKEEEKALGLFLALSKFGNKKQKAFAEAVKEISRKPSGQVDLIDPANPHKLWKLFSSKLSDEQLEGWTRILKETAEKAKSSRSKKDAFYEVLQSKAGKHEGMQERIDILKRKKCFFQ